MMNDEERKGRKDFWEEGQDSFICAQVGGEFPRSDCSLRLPSTFGC